jgi:hypothetical protein
MIRAVARARQRLTVTAEASCSYWPRALDLRYWSLCHSLYASFQRLSAKLSDGSYS